MNKIILLMLVTVGIVIWTIFKTNFSKIEKKTMSEIYTETNKSFQKCKKSIEARINDFENILKINNIPPMSREEIKRKFSISF